MSVAGYVFVIGVVVVLTGCVFAAMSLSLRSWLPIASFGVSFVATGAVIGLVFGLQELALRWFPA